MEAEREAQEAVRRADEQSRYAIEYRKRYSNTSERRENFKYKIRAEEEKAEALRLEALKAIDRARSASEEARPGLAPQPPKP
jgi:dsDNA-specific endonuclease/ATPase MutS2